MIDQNGKLRVADSIDASELSITDVGVKFKSVVSGDNLFYAIDENNEIWTNGSFEKVKSTFSLIYATKKHEFKMHKTGLKGTNVSTCGMNTACISPEGALVFWPTFCRVNRPPDYQYPESVEFDNDEPTYPVTIETPEELCQVALGDHHILTLAISGSVYFAQKKFLGLIGDEDLLSTADFKKVNFPRAPHSQPGTQNIVQIACSEQQSACLSADGLVYVWGKSFNSRKLIKTPTCIDILPAMVKSISMSHEHILALTQNNEVYAWGMDNCGQCGILDEHGNGNHIDKPKLVEKLIGYKVTQVSAGSSHSLVIFE